MERPPFVRRTKHSGVGHEDIGYSYVVIRRGPRPSIPDVKVGRLGALGKRQKQLEEARRPPVELELDDGSPQTSSTHVIASIQSDKTTESRDRDPEEIKALMKAEAFHWPRLVLPPLKKSGHVVMDVCGPSGVWPSVYVAVYQLTLEYRQNFAYDRSEVSREAAVLRCPQVFLGRHFPTRAKESTTSQIQLGKGRKKPRQEHLTDTIRSIIVISNP
jgi:hypothetical protein